MGALDTTKRVSNFGMFLCGIRDCQSFSQSEALIGTTHFGCRTVAIILGRTCVGYAKATLGFRTYHQKETIVARVRFVSREWQLPRAVEFRALPVRQKFPCGGNRAHGLQPLNWCNSNFSAGRAVLTLTGTKLAQLGYFLSHFGLK